MSVFEAVDYLAFVNQKLRSPAGGAPRGQVKALAAKLRCHPTFVSQILGGKAHFNHEQAVLFCEYIQLSDEESEFFIDLLNRDRAGSRSSRAHFQRVLDRKTAERKIFQKRAAISSTLTREQEIQYFSRWAIPIAHAAIQIPELRKSDKLAKAMSWSTSMTINALDTLEQLKLAEEKLGCWLPTKETLHIGRDSPLNSTFHVNWRLKTAAQLAEHDRAAEEIHYSSAFAISPDAAEEIREIILSSLQTIRTKMCEAKPEALYSFCLDFAPVIQSGK